MLRFSVSNRIDLGDLNYKFLQVVLSTVEFSEHIFEERMLEVMLTSYWNTDVE